MLTSPILIHYQVGGAILASSFCLSVNTYSNSEKPGSSHLSFIYLIVQLQHNCRVYNFDQSKNLLKTSFGKFLSKNILKTSTLNSYI